MCFCLSGAEDANSRARSRRGGCVESHYFIAATTRPFARALIYGDVRIDWTVFAGNSGAVIWLASSLDALRRARSEIPAALRRS